MASYIYGSDDAFRQKHLTSRADATGIDMSKMETNSAGDKYNTWSDIYSKGFDAAGKAGQEFTSSYNFESGEGGKTDWAAFYEGLGKAKTGAWDSHFDPLYNGSDSLMGNAQWGKNTTLAPTWDFTGQTTASPKALLGESALSPTGGAWQEGLDQLKEDNPAGLSSRSATQEDVDAGRALKVGDVIEDLNYNPGWKNTLLTDFEKLADAEKRAQTDIDAAADTFASGYSAANTKAEGLAAGLNPWQDAMRTASSELEAAQNKNQESKYQAVTDLLRGNMARGQRAGEFGTVGAQNRLVLGAQIQAAQERSGLDEKAALEEAEREYTLAGNVANAQRAINDAKLAKRETLRAEFAKDREEIIAEFAETAGATLEQTEPFIKLSEEIVQLMIDQGELDVLAAKEKRKELLSTLAHWAKFPTQYETQIVQLTRKVVEAGLRDQKLKDEAMDKLESMSWLSDLIFEVISYDEFANLNSEDANNLFETLANYAMGTGGNPLMATNSPLAERIDTALNATITDRSENAEGDQGFLSTGDLMKDSGNSLSKLISSAKDSLGLKKDDDDLSEVVVEA